MEIWRSQKDKIFLFCTFLLVVLITFMPSELERVIIEQAASLVKSIFPVASLFDSNNFFANLGHVFVFFLLGQTLGRFNKSIAISRLAAILIALAICSELLQNLIAGRDPSLEDVILDISSGLTGLFLSSIPVNARRVKTEA